MAATNGLLAGAALAFFTFFLLFFLHFSFFTFLFSLGISKCTILCNTKDEVMN